ncbi:ferritin family protein [Sulfurospirillum oryzae]|uniref:ferritin family protein n=1 Tax=Sulfurospirillum oryzae TaxID=2976535 RepID=UPI0021E9A7E1|nr:ferritin family protein [Sulfurospirillum oryzae]
MNVYEYAMKVEKDGERYYRELAEKTKDKGVKSILTMLADEEVKHYIVFDRMNKNQIIPTQPSVDLFSHTKNIFEKMRKENQSPRFSQDQIEFYKSALRSEENSYKFYIEKALMIEDSEQKAAFLRIAEEERAHYVLLENLVEYISAPESWIESAEFNHMSEKFVQKITL